MIHLKNERVFECIKSNDIIYFDLEFSEIWLEIEMMLCCEDREESIIFELKVNTDWSISRLKNILTKCGISSLKQTEFYDPSSFYIYTEFNLIFSNKMVDSIELDKFDGNFF